jgi:hypothetical protein
MQRKIALLLAIALILTTFATATQADQVYAASNKVDQVMKATGIMNTEQGSSDLNTDAVTRARFSQILINASILKDVVSSTSNVSLFSDVKKSYPYAGYIKTAVSQGWMTGYLNGSFKPAKGITLQEAVTAILKLLGYSNSDFTGGLSNGVMTMYKSKGLSKNMNKSKTETLTVNDCKQLLYNALNATTKEGKIYATTLGYELDSNGEIDYLSLINTEIVGPIIVDSDWKDEIPFSVSSATYYLGDRKVNYADLDTYDVLYYSEGLKTIWIYDDKVTGSIQSVNPNYITPQSVTISGNTYNFADSEVSYQFSTMGTVKAGDIVTILLGKEGTVVDVLRMDEYNTTFTGLVLSTGTHLVEKNDTYVNTRYITYVDASGNLFEQDYDDKNYIFMEGDLVRVTFEEGIASITNYNTTGRAFGNNTFNKDASKLGDVTLASDIDILDVKGNRFISVYPERLAGTILGSNSVHYYELNTRGELTQLILNDITGDLDSYGVFTGFESAAGKTTYNYLIGNQGGSYSAASLGNLYYKEGPIGLEFDNKVLTSTYALLEINVTSIGKTTVQSGSMKYTMAEECHVYYLTEGEYIATTLSKVSDLNKYKVKAFYDEPNSLGGRIRVIVAEMIDK